MRRFYAPPNKIGDSLIHFDHLESHHISNVLRLSRGQEIEVFDGQGRIYTCEIRDVNDNAVVARIITERIDDCESTIQITLFQGLPKSNKMDYIIEKCTEIGISHIVPVNSIRTIVKISHKKEQNKIRRWQRIAAEAAKQSNRSKIPKISQVTTMEEACKEAGKCDLALIPWECESTGHIKTVLKTHKPASAGIFIGPEGGFSNDEINNAVKEGIIPVSLGPRILRTETAGLVTLAIILYEYGEI